MRGSRLVWFVWSGLAGLGVLSSVGGVTTRSVLSVRLFGSCCMLYTVLVSVLSLRAFVDIKLDIGDIELPS